MTLTMMVLDAYDQSRAMSQACQVMKPTNTKECVWWPSINASLMVHALDKDGSLNGILEKQDSRWRSRKPGSSNSNKEVISSNNDMDSNSKGGSKHPIVRAVGMEGRNVVTNH